MSGRRGKGETGTALASLTPGVCWSRGSLWVCFWNSGPLGRLLAISLPTLPTPPGGVGSLGQLGEYPAPIRGNEPTLAAGHVLAHGHAQCCCLGVWTGCWALSLESDPNPDVPGRLSISLYRCFPSA